MCPKCNTKITEGIGYCPNCGQQLKTNNLLIIIGALIGLLVLFFGYQMLSSAFTKVIHNNKSLPIDKINGPVNLNSDIQNYHAKITMHMVLVALGREITLDLTSSGVSDWAHHAEHYTIKTEIMGKVVRSDVYTDFITKMTYQQDSISKQWYKVEGVAPMFNLQAVIENLQTPGKAKMLTEERYELKVTGDELYDMLICSGAGYDFSDVIVPKDLTATVFIKGKYITKIKYDFSDMVTSFKKLTIVAEFSKYNDAGDVTIPSFIQKGAGTSVDA